MTIKQSILATIGKTRRGATLVALRSLLVNSELRESGWFDSRLLSMPVDAKGQPLPWYTYSAIAFLGGRTAATMKVFEYGSGNSTLWWGSRVRAVVSCEHDASWYNVMCGKLPANVEYEHAPLDPAGDYPRRIQRFQNEFDVVVIDGRQRVACAFNALPALKADGIVVWDNSDRAEYQEGYDALTLAGFRRLDFWGMGPINTYAWCTSVFYRPGNCMGI